MKLSLAAVAVLLVSAIPLPSDRETVWSAWIAEQKNGTAEFVTPDGSRVDVLTDEYAYEVEWVKKWPEAVGQSVLYGLATNRKPAIVLLTNGEDERYYLRCLAVCGRLGIRVETVDVKPPRGRR